uniref:Pre-mRNA-splicing factor SLU7 n=1 Tax=Lactuca sativa TaxID=4236 RepID=A0A9R1XHS5_LACSA|nr:hypothetical protein LSAT_V11C300119000 [Lactuca sativa]
MYLWLKRVIYLQFDIGDVLIGDTTTGFKQLNIHAWEAFEKGNDVHMQSAPSQAELFEQREAKISSEGEVEYDRAGRIIKDQKSIASKKDPESSKKHEDIKQPSLLPLQEKLSGIWFS